MCKITKLKIHKRLIRTARVQILVHKGMLWSISSSSNNSKCKNIIRNSFISLYALSRDLQLPPLAAILCRSTT